MEYTKEELDRFIKELLEQNSKAYFEMGFRAGYTKKLLEENEKIINEIGEIKL